MPVMNGIQTSREITQFLAEPNKNYLNSETNHHPKTNDSYTVLDPFKNSSPTIIASHTAHYIPEMQTQFSKAGI